VLEEMATAMFNADNIMGSFMLLQVVLLIMIHSVRKTRPKMVCIYNARRNKAYFELYSGRTLVYDAP
jgi:hypothetical protein